ncbi:MAG: thioredoxin family protein [Ruminococcus sp.]|nr:thioredoxin family protein [Ruminococcus sp.]
MNESNLEVKIKNLTYIVLLGFLVIGILIIGLYFKGNNSYSSGNNSSSGGSSNSDAVSYDVSKMNAVNADEALALFNDKGTHILYIGRSNCSVCVSLVPLLNKLQEELKYTTDYYNLTQTQNWKTDMAELIEKFTIETTVNSETGTIAKLFSDHGYTPTVIIIKDGKAVDGFIGYRDYDTLKELVSKYI